MIILVVALAALVFPTISLMLLLTGRSAPNRTYLFNLASGICLAGVGITLGDVFIKIIAAVGLILTLKEIAWYQRLKERIAALEKEVDQ